MKTTLSIIAAAALSGSAYGQLHNGWFEAEEARRREATSQLQERMEAQREWMAQRQAEAAAAQQREQLEEIQAAQRQQRSSEYMQPQEWNPWQAMEQRRIERNRETYLRHYLEDCE